ncbi:hypothetical protein CCHR01_00761 [Colletotrichum chrysophilum]|uniref:Uncharacterized protein n=1 Tax=Colletotrichum chrysophilum TaxID=1836956 RepID=A0AAD9AZS9_9PEZI|nr:hypothetical protein CCHR01_00761 [Colletotrichum chrysophilum]
MNPGKSEKSGEGKCPREDENKTRQYKSRKRPGDSSNPSNKRPENNGAYRVHRKNRKYPDISYIGPGGYQLSDHMAEYLYSHPPPPPPPPPEANPNTPPKVRPLASSQPHPYPVAAPRQPPTGSNMNGAWLPPFHQPGYRPIPHLNVAPGWWNGVPPAHLVLNVPVNQPAALPPYPYPHPLPQAPYVHQGPPRYGQGFQEPDFVPVFRPKPRQPRIEDMPPCVDCGIGLVQQQVRDLLSDKDHEKSKKARRRKERAAAAAQKDAMAKNVAFVRDEFGKLLEDSVRDVMVRRRDRLRDLDVDPEPHRRAIPLEYRRSKTPVAITQDLWDSLERGRALEQSELTLQQITELISRTRGLELQSSKGDTEDERHKQLESLQAQVDSLEARTVPYQRRPELIMDHPTFPDARFAEARQHRTHSQPPRGRQHERYFMNQRPRTPRSRSRRRPYHFVGEELHSPYEDGLYSDSYEGLPELRRRPPRRYHIPFAPEVPDYYES